MSVMRGQVCFFVNFNFDINNKLIYSCLSIDSKSNSSIKRSKNTTTIDKYAGDNHGKKSYSR